MFQKKKTDKKKGKKRIRSYDNIKTKREKKKKKPAIRISTILVAFQKQSSLAPADR